MKEQIKKFGNCKGMLLCPVCKGLLNFYNGVLKCTNFHCFDIASKGYINLLPNRKKQEGYDKNFFSSRRFIMENGFYDHIIEAVIDFIPGEGLTNNILDAGCGEGFYSLAISNKTNSSLYAIDFSGEAIKRAANGGSNIKWIVADIVEIPIVDNSIHCVLNIFSPANYTEFKRVLCLKEEGIIIKAVPGKNHLQQLRYAVRNYIKSESYTNQDVVNHFQKYFKIRKQICVSKTLTINQEQMEQFLNMTPLMFNIDKHCIDLNQINYLTIESELLIGTI